MKNSSPQEPGKTAIPRSWRFSSTAGTESIKNLDLQIDAIKNRIDVLDSRAVLVDETRGEMRILKQIVAISSDAEQLEVLGKALVRVSEFITDLKELEDKKRVADILSKNPSWLVSAFVDVDEDLEHFVASFEEKTD